MFYFISHRVFGRDTVCFKTVGHEANKFDG